MDFPVMLELGLLLGGFVLIGIVAWLSDARSKM